MIKYSMKIDEHLGKYGWHPERKLLLPSYIERETTPDIVTSIIENLYGLECKSITGRARVFTVDDAYIQDFDEDITEYKEDSGLEMLDFYPLGSMSEYGGILLLDNYGRFYLADGELLYYGANINEFFDIAFFKKRSAISIRENRKTYYCHDGSYTGYLFDEKKGWLGDSNMLTIEHLEKQWNEKRSQ